MNDGISPTPASRELAEQQDSSHFAANGDEAKSLQPLLDALRWVPVGERLPTGDDAVSCEAWCQANEEGDFPGPCVMSFDEGEWNSREDTGCWQPGEVTHWRPRPTAPRGDGIDGPRRGPLADGSQTPNDAAEIPCAKAGRSVADAA